MMEQCFATILQKVSFFTDNPAHDAYVAYFFLLVSSVCLRLAGIYVQISVLVRKYFHFLVKVLG